VDHWQSAALVEPSDGVIRGDANARNGVFTVSLNQGSSSQRRCHHFNVAITKTAIVKTVMVLKWSRAETVRTRPLPLRPCCRTASPAGG
jgi:hypothetical protein